MIEESPGAVLILKMAFRSSARCDKKKYST